LTLAVFPTAAIFYSLSRGEGDDRPYLTKVLASYDHWLETWHNRNALHTKMVEQAGADRLLFFNSSDGKAARPVDVKFQEYVN
jgi:hypothetical protein